jgi:predicted component of type VI protein secretion system
MALRLVSPDGTQSFDLRDGAPLIVGRAPTSDIPVFDPTISRRHAEIVAENGTLNIRDLGSSNGTYINDEGKPLTAGQSRTVGDGDRVHVGAWTTITLHAPAPH